MTTRKTKKLILISTKKKYAGIGDYTGLKEIADNHVNWRTEFNIVNQPNSGWKKIKRKKIEL